MEMAAVPTVGELVLNIGGESNLFGVNVMVTKDGLEGWYGGGVPVRRNEQERLWAHGNFSLPGTRGARVVTVTGVAWGDSRRAAGELTDLLNSVMADGTIGKLTVNDPDIGTRSVNCFLTGTPEVDWDYEDTLTWTLDFECPNPRKFGPAVQYDTGISEPGGGLTFPLFAGTPYEIGRTNLATNPSAQTNTTNYAALPGTGGAAAISRPTTGGKMGGAYPRVTWSTAGTGGSAGLVYTEPLPAELGKPLSASAWLRSSVSKRVALLVRFRNGTTVQTGQGAIVTSYVQLAANTWTEYKVEGLVSTGTATNVQVYALVHNSDTNAVGHTLDMDGVLIESAGTLRGPYFDGDTPDDTNYLYGWTGTANASTSTASTILGADGVLDFGVAGRMGTVTFKNTGTADTYPEFWVRGYTPYFMITELETGRQLEYVGEVPQFQTLFLNAANGAVYLNTIEANRLDGLGRDEWPAIPGGATRTYLFDSPEGTNARLFFRAAPAWW